MSSLLSHFALSRIVQHTFVCIVLSSTALLSTASAQTLKAGDITPFEVVYEVGNNLVTAGTARLSLTKNGDRWNYSLSTRPKGVFKLAGKGRIDEQSSFVLTESDGNISIQSQEYSYRQDDEKSREVDAVFDWNLRMITHAYRGEEATDTFNKPVIDRLTATVYIISALKNGFTQTELSIFDSGKIKQVEFINMGEETIKTPLGKIDTIRVVNRSPGGSSRETSTWFAPSLDYLPIKIEQHKRGELVARLSLLSLETAVKSVELGGAMPVNNDLAKEEATRLLQQNADDSQ